MPDRQTATKQRVDVVIVGGGFGACYVTAGVSKAFARAGSKDVQVHVSLVTERDYFEVTPGMTRGMVNAEFGKSLSVLHSAWTAGCTNVAVIVDKVTSCSGASVTLSSGKELAYDYLVIATGSSYPRPFKSSCTSITERHDEIEAVAALTATSKHILVVGTGLVGVEAAAEILHQYPEKRVTIVGQADTLLPGKSAWVQNHVRKHFARYPNVEFLLGDSAILPAEDPLTFSGDVATKGGRVIADVDMIVPAVGVSLNNQFLRNSDSDMAGLLDEHGQVLVDETHCVPGRRNIYAIGDISSYHKAKLCLSVTIARRAVINNIVASIRGKPATYQDLFRVGSQLFFCVLGPNDGTASVGPVPVPSVFMRLTKSRDLFAPRLLGDLYDH